MKERICCLGKPTPLSKIETILKAENKETENEVSVRNVFLYFLH